MIRNLYTISDIIEDKFSIIVPHIFSNPCLFVCFLSDSIIVVLCTDIKEIEILQNREILKQILSRYKDADDVSGWNFDIILTEFHRIFEIILTEFHQTFDIILTEFHQTYNAVSTNFLNTQKDQSSSQTENYLHFLKRTSTNSAESHAREAHPKGGVERKKKEHKHEIF